jgi:hypothetical protein
LGFQPLRGVDTANLCLIYDNQRAAKWRASVEDSFAKERIDMKDVIEASTTSAVSAGQGAAGDINPRLYRMEAFPVRQ